MAIGFERFRGAPCYCGGCDDCLGYDQGAECGNCGDAREDCECYECGSCSADCDCDVEVAA